MVMNLIVLDVYKRKCISLRRCFSIALANAMLMEYRCLSSSTKSNDILGG